jgi:hypothetical protein
MIQLYAKELLRVKVVQMAYSTLFFTLLLGLLTNEQWMQHIYSFVNYYAARSSKSFCEPQIGRGVKRKV